MHGISPEQLFPGLQHILLLEVIEQSVQSRFLTRTLKYQILLGGDGFN